MAKVKIQGNASGTGVLTVTAPNTSTDRTITLPDEDVTLGAATPSIDDNGNATAITIDSDENVLIGKTTYVGGSAVTGIDIRPAGMLNIAREGDTLMYMNRKTSDGDIVEFRKDGASIGSIGVDGGDNFYITGESGNTGGIYINDAAVSPAYQGAERDDYYSLGKAPARWKDLYLSGGLKVGGTGAANTLDDYEEGTWSPTITCTTSGSYTLQGAADLAAYTKIGRVVTVQGGLSVNGESSPNGNLRITLPFTAFQSTDDTDFSMGNLALGNHGSTLDVAGLNAFVMEGNYFFIWGVNPDGTTRYINHNDVDTSWQVYFNFTYIAA